MHALKFKTQSSGPLSGRTFNHISVSLCLTENDSIQIGWWHQSNGSFAVIAYIVWDFSTVLQKFLCCIKCMPVSLPSPLPCDSFSCLMSLTSCGLCRLSLHPHSWFYRSCWGVSIVCSIDNVVQCSQHLFLKLSMIKNQLPLEREGACVPNT